LSGVSRKKFQKENEFLYLPADRISMTTGQKFCTECGSILVPQMKFCGQCGHPVTMQDAASPAPHPTSSFQPTPGQPVPVAQADHEQITGIVPFLEQGLLSVNHFTLIVTTRRMIFCTWKAATNEAMAEADDVVMQESCSIEETTDEITHFRAKDWSEGPWQQYRSMTPDTIIAAAPGSLSIPFRDIISATIICETTASTQDSLSIRDGKAEYRYDLMYSQGPFLFRILEPVLGERISMTDHLHKRRGLDRLLSSQEYT
jgi:hypothetical protein